MLLGRERASAHGGPGLDGQLRGCAFQQLALVVGLQSVYGFGLVFELTDIVPAQV